MTPATPAQLRALDDEAFIPAASRSAPEALPRVENHEGTRTGRFSAAEPNLSNGGRGGRPPRRFAVSDVFSDQGVIVHTYDGEWPDPIKAAEAWEKVYAADRAAGFNSGATQFRVREIPADAETRDFNYEAPMEAEGRWLT